MIRKTLTVLLIVVLGSALTYARESELQNHVEKRKNGGAGGFTIGIGQFDLSNLNQRLRTRGFETLDGSQVCFGGAGYGIVNGRILLGGEGSGFGQDVASGTQKASLSGGWGFFDVGYVVLSRRNFNLFPLLGIGGGGFNFRIVEKAVSPTFDEILDNPKQEANIFTGSFLLNFALGVDYSLIFGESKKGHGGLLLGILAGYIFDPIKADWKMGDADVLDGPDLRMTGPYVKLIIGGSGTRK